jgi:prevent-host-death family protein
MKIVPVAEAKAKLSEYLEKSRSDVVIITKNGRPVAILSGISEDDDLDSIVLANDPKFRRLLRQREEQITKGEYLEHEAFWKSVED